MMGVSGCANLPVSFFPDMHKALAQIKKAAARANNKIGAMNDDIAEAIAQACDEIIEGKFADQFPLDMWQGGGYTCVNMNINEVVGNRANEILTGKITEWNDIYPSKLGKIQVVFDHSGSSVVKYMADSVLKGKPFADNVYSAGAMKAVFETVKERKNAIGLVGVSWISADLKSADLTAEERVKTLEADDTTATTFTDEVKVLGINRNNSTIAYKPYQAYIFDGNYPLYRSIYMINTGASGSLANGFFAFVTSFRGQKLMMSTGVLPATVHHRMVSVD